MATWTNVERNHIPYYRLLISGTDVLLWNGTDDLLIDEIDVTNTYTNITKN
jgi:hypothetical protein